MSKKIHLVKLSDEQSGQLVAMMHKGKASARQLTRARILLKADQGAGGEGWSDERIAEALSTGLSTVERVRRRFAEGGLAAALRHKPQQNRRRRRLDGAGEAQLIMLGCSAPPEGRRRWTLQLLADRLVALGCAEQVSYETVRRVMKKKRAEALAEKKLVSAGQAQRRLRLRHGGRAQRL